MKKIRLDLDWIQIARRYLLPSIFTMMGTALYVLGDTMVVGRGLGREGLAALNLSIPMINILNGMGLLWGIGSSSRLSIAKGRNDRDKVLTSFAMGLLGSILTGLVALFLFRFKFDELVNLLVGNSLEKDMAREYLNALLWFTPFFLVFHTLLAMVRNDGSTKLAMFAMLFASAFNVVLDYIMIFPLQRGLGGGALATGLAQVVGVIILLAHFFRKENNLKLPSLEQLKQDNLAMFESFKIGLPSLIVEWSQGLVIFLFNMVIIGITGDIGISSYSIIANLSLIFTAILIGVAHGIQPLISYSSGAGELRSKRRFYITALKWIIGLGFIIWFIGLAVPGLLANVFVDDDMQLIEMTKRGIRLYFTAFTIMGINLLYTVYLQSIDKPRQALIVSLLRGLFMIIPALLLLSRFFGMDGVWMTIFTSELLTIFVVFLFFGSFTDILLGNGYE